MDLCGSHFLRIYVLERHLLLVVDRYRRLNISQWHGKSCQNSCYILTIYCIFILLLAKR